MTKFGDITEFFTPGLTLTVLGREYTLPLASAEVGLWCRTIAATTEEVTAASSDDELRAAGERARKRAAELPPLPDGDLTFEQVMLGATYAEMIADKVPDPYIQFCAQTASIWIAYGESTAERFWRAGGRPETMARGNRAERRANTPTTGTGEAAATPQPGSTSGTSSRPRSKRNGPGSGSRGRKS